MRLPPLAIATGLVFLHRFRSACPQPEGIVGSVRTNSFQCPLSQLVTQLYVLLHAACEGLTQRCRCAAETGGGVPVSGLEDGGGAY